MASPEKTVRDTRIDVLRALALITIFIDHVPGTLFEHFTYRNLGFSDAAEAFVLISGMSVALAYGGKFRPGSRALPLIKMWRRAGVLYVAHIIVTMITIALFCAAAVFLKRPDFLAQNNIAPLVAHPAETLVGIALLGHQIGYNNILSLYAALLLIAPLLFLLAEFSMAVMLTLSGAVWLLSGLYQIAAPNYPEPGFWFLNPLSWQFLFAIGMACVLHVRRGGRVPVNRWLVGAAGAYAIMAFIWIHSPLWGAITWFGLPPVIGGFDKTFLSLLRLLHILSIAYLVVALPLVSKLARRSVDNPLAILGKRSLPIFIAGTILAMMAQIMKTIGPPSPIEDTLLIGGGILIQFVLAYYLVWLNSLGKGGEAARPARAEEPFALVAPVPVRIKAG